MAYSNNNPLMQKVSGKLGDTLVVKQVNGKTVFCKVSKPGGKESPEQKNNRDQFREASAWAKQTLLDPVQNESFCQEAKRLNLTNPYTAALRFKLREIKEVSQLGTWTPELTLAEATASAIRRQQMPVEPASTILNGHSVKTVEANEVIQLRKAIEEMNRSFREELAAMQRSVQEGLMEMNKAIAAIGELLQPAQEVRPQVQREQLKHSLRSSLRPALASMELLRRSAMNIP